MSQHADETTVLLEMVRTFTRRFVVVGDCELDAVALWTLHTYVYECAPATPYLHPYSPEPGSGKTTLLDVLELTARNAIQADNLTEAVLFRMIDAHRPTLLFDEVDAVFGKKNSDSTEGIRQVLNSGYRKGKKAWRCVPPTHEVKDFDVYCPKATAGLNELPATLAHRSIPISMKPPRPSDVYQDLDREEVEAEAETLRIGLQAWADNVEDALRDPRLKPATLKGLDPRGNEIWRILFRIADLAGGEWPERARSAAVALSGGERRHDDTSIGVRLLGHIEAVCTTARVTCKTLVDDLNAIEDAPYGGWNEGKGITTRELGRRLARYEIHAKPIRIDGERAGNGYELEQFADAFARYLPSKPVQPVQPAWLSQKEAQNKPVQDGLVPVAGNGENPHGYSDVPVVPVSEPESRLALGDPGYALQADKAFAGGSITGAELADQLRLDGFVRRARRAAA